MKDSYRFPSRKEMAKELVTFLRGQECSLQQIPGGHLGTGGQAKHRGKLDFHDVARHDGRRGPNPEGTNR